MLGILNWFIALFAPVVIGRSNYFGVGITTATRNRANSVVVFFFSFVCLFVLDLPLWQRVCICHTGLHSYLHSFHSACYSVEVRLILELLLNHGSFARLQIILLS